MIYLGKTIKLLRERLGLSQRAAAIELGISYVYLNRMEKNLVVPTATIIERFHSAWGVDLYMLAVCFFAKPERYPDSMRESMQSLKVEWQKQIDEIVQLRDKEGDKVAKHSKANSSCKVDRRPSPTIERGSRKKK